MIIFLKNIVTVDETWVYGYAVKTESPVFTLGLKNVSHIQKSTASLVLCESDAVFFYCEGIMHHEFFSLWADGEQGILSMRGG